MLRSHPRRRSALAAQASLSTLLAALTAGGALAQTARRGTERAAPPPPIAYAAEEARCADGYHASLATLRARPSPQPTDTLARIKSPLPAMKGGFLFQDGGERRRQRDAQNRMIDGDRVCVDEQQRGGRIRCLAWETRAAEPPREPPVATPPMTKDEARLSKQIVEFVQNRGVPPEFLSNGKYTIMSERAAADLDAYMSQPPHPALCAGAIEFVEFLEDRLPLLKKRTDDVFDLEVRARALAVPRVDALEEAITASPKAQAVAAKSPTGALELAQRTARLALTAPEAAAVAKEPAALPALARIATALNSEAGSPLSAANLAVARAALRTIELAAHVEHLADRYRDLDAALFGTLADVRKAHAATCTCVR